MGGLHYDDYKENITKNLCISIGYGCVNTFGIHVLDEKFYKTRSINFIGQNKMLGDYQRRVLLIIIISRAYRRNLM